MSRAVRHIRDNSSRTTSSASVTHMAVLIFLFQAEDGIRDLTVTGVQTCALPISLNSLSSAAVSEGTPLRILVAEDSEFNVQLMQKLLAKRGHRVRVVSNGREALALAKSAQFDLLLLDVHMPELDGFQVIAGIREHEQSTGSHLPVIALTARSRKEDRELCLAAGM